jgi:hypothetical protein
MGRGFWNTETIFGKWLGNSRRGWRCSQKFLEASEEFARRGEKCRYDEKLDELERNVPKFH